MSPAHPRSRGENETLTLRIGEREGSSPLTRGKLTDLTVPYGLTRLIPAHAGKTTFPKMRLGLFAAHPRSRGENLKLLFQIREWRGSSPLTRGKRACGDAALDEVRLIPAHAGKTAPCTRLR